MDPLSVGAGVAGLLTLTQELAQSFAAYGRAVKHERDNVQHMVSELDVLRSVLQKLDKFLRSKRIAGVTFHQSSAFETAVTTCNETIRGLEERLRKLGADRLSRVVERLRWPFSEKDELKALETLRRCTSTFQFALTVEGW